MRLSSSMLLVLCFAFAVLLHLAAAPMLAYHLLRVNTMQRTAIPQLDIRELHVPESHRIDRPLTVSWQVENRGHVIADVNWTDRVYLSRTPAIDETAVALADVAVNTPLDPGSRYTKTVENIQLNNDWIGLAYIVVKTDADDELAEHFDTQTARFDMGLASQNTHATRAKPIWLEPNIQPTLAVGDIQSPQRAIAGGSLRVAYTIDNDSEGVAWRPWRDAVVLSADSTLDDEDLLLTLQTRPHPLMPGESYTQQTGEIRLPRGFDGTYYLIIAADALNALERHFQKHDATSDETDNANIAAIARTQPAYCAVPIELESLNLPDLHVLDINPPELVVADEPAEANFRIINRGDAATGDQPWLDAVYLSRSPERDSDSIELLALPNQRPLKPGQRYRSDNVPFTVPGEWADGDVYLIVHTDIEGHIDEGEYDQNNTMAIKLDVVPERPQSDFGKAEPPYEMTMAWIAYEDFRKLEAEQGDVLQPAVQATEDPTPDAPLTIEAQQPTPVQQANEAAQQAVPDEQQVPSDSQQDQPPGETAAATNPQTRAQPAARPAGGDINPVPDADDVEGANVQSPLPMAQQAPPTPMPQDHTETEPADQPDEEAREGVEAHDEPDVAQQPTDQPQQAEQNPGDVSGEDETAGKPTTPETAQTAVTEETQPRPPQPTAAPRADRESPPVMRVPDTIQVQPGAVLTSEGIEIKTFAPRVSIIARSSTIPNNPEAVLTFDSNGDVVEVRMVRSTGAENWDGPVIASLYRWKATGKRIDELEGYLEIRVQMLLSASSQ